MSNDKQPCDEFVKELNQVGEEIKRLSFQRMILNQKPDKFLSYGGMMVKAADIIERLQAEIEELKGKDAKCG